MIKQILIGGALVLLSLSVSGESRSPQPNIILIVADDLGYGDLGCYGQQKIRTPFLDRMAAEGMRFTAFYSGCTVCAPSRASLMTGLHTGHTAIRGNKEFEPEGQFPLPDSSFTIAKMLKQAGYTTGNFGKWGLGFVGTSGDPLNQGFDRFFGYNCQRQSHNYYPDHLWDNRKRFDLPNSSDNQQAYSPELIQEKALEFIDQQADAPFFLYLSYTLPHAALQTERGDSLFSVYKREFNEIPKKVPLDWNGNGYQPQGYPRAAYAAMVSRLDAYVGQILQKIKDRGLDDNTIIVFTSDNGPHLEGGNDPDFFNSNGGFRGHKRDMYEGGIRIPLIVRWPGTIKAGAVSGHTGAFWDLMPSFAALGKSASKFQTDGISILPVLLEKKAEKAHRLLYWEFVEHGWKRAVRKGKWKAVEIYNPATAQVRIELYNLEKDPGEKADVALNHQKIAREMKLLMDREHRENKDFPLAISGSETKSQ